MVSDFSDILNVGIKIPDCQERRALGVVMEASVGRGIYKNPIEAAKRMVESSKRIIALLCEK